MKTSGPKFDSFSKLPDYLQEFRARGYIASGAIVVFGALCAALNRESGACFPSVATISDKVGFTDRTVRRHLRDLEHVGAITRVARSRGGSGAQTSNQYELRLARPTLPEDFKPLPNRISSDDIRGGIRRAISKGDNPWQTAGEEKLGLAVILVLIECLNPLEIMLLVGQLAETGWVGFGNQLCSLYDDMMLEDSTYFDPETIQALGSLTSSVLAEACGMDAPLAKAWRKANRGNADFRALLYERLYDDGDDDVSLPGEPLAIDVEK